MSRDKDVGVEERPENSAFWERFRTRPRMLAEWLHASRENWKRKYQAIKVDLHRWQVRVGDVTQSRERWKEQALAKDRELAAMKSELERLQQQVQEREKKERVSADTDSRSRPGRPR